MEKSSQPVIAFLVLLVVGCTSTPPFPTEARVALTYSSGRQGEIEPCGCHARPLGGVDRELNARAAMHSAEAVEFSLASGPQFLPATLSNQKAALRKASYLSEAWKVLHTDVAAADARDFLFGAATFQTWANASESSWISANLYSGGRALFRPYVEKAYDDTTLRFFGVSGCGLAPQQHGVECREPLRALRSALADAPPKGINILLSSLSGDEMEQVFQDFSDIAIVFNSPDGSALPGVVEEPGHRWLASPTPRGRALARVEFGRTVAEAVNSTVWIDASYAEPKNLLSDLVEKWRAAQHDAEVNGD